MIRSENSKSSVPEQVSDSENRRIRHGKQRLKDEGREFAILTDEITRAWSGLSTRQYKEFKGLKKENLRDNMSTTELVLNMLAEY